MSCSHKTLTCTSATGRARRSTVYIPTGQSEREREREGEREDLIASSTKEKVKQNYYRRLSVKKLSSE